MAGAATTTTPRTGLVVALIAAVLLVGHFASRVEATELSACDLTEVDGVQTLVVGSDITKLADNICKSNNNIKAVDFSQATSLTEIGDYVFKDSTLAGHVDLRNLPKLTKTGMGAFSNTEIRSIDFSNCPKLGYIGIDSFSWNDHLVSFVAKNVGRDGSNEDDLSMTGLSTNGDFSGALMFGYWQFGRCPNLALFDFRGTAVGIAENYYTKWSYGGRHWGFENTGYGTLPDDYTHPFANKWGATLSYEKCKVMNGVPECCFDANGNDFTCVDANGNDCSAGNTAHPNSNANVGKAIPANPVVCTPATCASAASDFTCGDGSTPKAGTPSCSDDPCAAEDFASGGSCCEACAETNVATWTGASCNIETCATGYEKTAANECTDIDGCAGNPTCGAGTTCADVEAPGTGYECKAKCSDLDVAACSTDQVLSDTLFCQGTTCTADDGDTCCVARANCSTITCAAGTEAKTTSADVELCAGATCDSATDDNDLCCQEIDGCAASPDCGTNATCADVEAPGTGHECRCDDGFTGTTTTDDTAATCTPVQLGGAALPSTSSAAVWIVSSIFASVFAVSSCGA